MLAILAYYWFCLFGSPNWKIWIKRNFEKRIKKDGEKTGLFILELFL
jgi:hypothetical protein